MVTGHIDELRSIRFVNQALSTQRILLGHCKDMGLGLFAASSLFLRALYLYRQASHEKLLNIVTELWKFRFFSYPTTDIREGLTINVEGLP